MDWSRRKQTETSSRERTKSLTSRAPHKSRRVQKPWPSHGVLLRKGAQWAGSVDGFADTSLTWISYRVTRALISEQSVNNPHPNSTYQQDPIRATPPKNRESRHRQRFTNQEVAGSTAGRAASAWYIPVTWVTVYSGRIGNTYPNEFSTLKPQNVRCDYRSGCQLSTTVAACGGSRTIVVTTKN